MCMCSAPNNHVRLLQTPPFMLLLLILLMQLGVLRLRLRTTMLVRLLHPTLDLRRGHALLRGEELLPPTLLVVPLLVPPRPLRLLVLPLLVLPTHQALPSRVLLLFRHGWVNLCTAHLLLLSLVVLASHHDRSVLQLLALRLMPNLRFHRPHVTTVTPWLLPRLPKAADPIADARLGQQTHPAQLTRVLRSFYPSAALLAQPRAPRPASSESSPPSMTTPAGPSGWLSDLLDRRKDFPHRQGFHDPL